MSDNYKINREKFLGELKKRNLNMADIAREMGYSTKYLSNKVREGRPFSKGDINFLNAVYHLPYDNYKYEEKKTLTVDQVTATTATIEGKSIILNLPQEELKQLIYEAVYEGMKQALKEQPIINMPSITPNAPTIVPTAPTPITPIITCETVPCETQETLPFA